MGIAAQAMVVGALVAHFATAVAAESPYIPVANRAITWLKQQQNIVDGSWGASDDIKFLETSEAAQALSAMNQRSSEYYASLAFLKNRTTANSDYLARKVLALQGGGGDYSTDLQGLYLAQSANPLANGGFGLSSAYQGSALDSALVLQAYAQTGTGQNVSNALTFLKASQLSGADTGWAIGQLTSSDPVTTAQVLLALIPYRNAGDATLASPVANGMATLNAKVGTASSTIQRALAALANLKNDVSSQKAVALVESLVSTQRDDGSWDNDAYATSLVLRALAAAMSTDLSSQKQSVDISDAQLRRAINQSLGRNALDQLNRGELAQLTSFSARGLGLTDVTGLQYATNLRELDLRDNKLTSLSQLSFLSGVTRLLLSGNPLNIPANADSDSDSIKDKNEIDVGTNPFNSGSKPMFRNNGSVFDLSALKAATPEIGWQTAWHAFTDDFDHDGDLDFVLYFNGANENVMELSCFYDCGGWYQGPDFGVLVYLENVGGSYVRRPFSNGEDFITGDIEQLHHLDYDNDGKLDLLLVLNNSGTSSYYHPEYHAKTPFRRLVLMKNDSGSTGTHFSDVTVAVGLGNASWYAEGIVLDLNQDGYPDILGTSVSESTILGDAWVFSKATGTYIPAMTAGIPRPSWGVEAVVDLDNDGKLDLVISDSTKGLRFFRNQGNTSFSEWGNTLDLSALAGKLLVKTVPADINNDGRFDLVVFETVINEDDYAGGQVRLLVNGGITGSQIAFSEQPLSPASVVGGGITDVTRGGAVSDVNNDGLQDVFIATNGSSSRLLLADGSGNFQAAESLGFVVGLPFQTYFDDRFADPTFVDFDSDGKADLLSAKYVQPPADSGYYLLGNTGNWPGPGNSVTFELTGRVRQTNPSSGKDAFGARVEVIAGGRTLTRQVLPAMGTSRRLHFGLGSVSTGVQVKVYWPGNPTPQVLSGDSSINSLLRVTEP